MVSDSKAKLIHHQGNEDGLRFQGPGNINLSEAACGLWDWFNGNCMCKRRPPDKRQTEARQPEPATRKKPWSLLVRLSFLCFAFSAHHTFATLPLIALSASVKELDPLHRDAVTVDVLRILDTALAHGTFGQVIDGLPTRSHRVRINPDHAITNGKVYRDA